MRRGPSSLGLVLLGFAAGYAGRWLPELLPDYADWSLLRKVFARLVVLAVSAGLTWAFITWRIGLDARGNDPGPYWLFWSIGLFLGLILDEIHVTVDRMFD